MEEEKETQEKETQKIEEPKEDIIAKATETAERLENANKRMEELIEAQTKLQVEATFAGKSSAGSQIISKEEKEIDEARQFLKGTGYEDELFPK